MSLCYFFNAVKFSRMVRETRRSTEKGLRETASEIDISPATLSRIEHGGHPNIDTFLLVCQWLDIPPNEALDRPYK